MLVWESWKLIIDFNFLFCFGVFGVGQQHQQQQQQQQQQQVIMDDIEDIREENGSFFQVHKKTIVLVGVVAVIAVIWVVLVAVSSANWAPEQTLDTRVQTENIMKHLVSFSSFFFFFASVFVFNLIFILTIGKFLPNCS